jgi:hypothetical protein
LCFVWAPWWASVNDTSGGYSDAVRDRGNGDREWARASAGVLVMVVRVSEVWNREVEAPRGTGQVKRVELRSIALTFVCLPIDTFSHLDTLTSTAGAPYT